MNNSPDNTTYVSSPKKPSGESRKSLKLKKGDTLEARIDDKNGLLIYTKKVISLMI
jgi:hypothetical protein